MNKSNLNSAEGKTLYYDGQCPICSREIAKLESEKDNNLKLLDIHQVKDLPKDKEILLGQLHLKDENGNWLTGLEANVAAWQHTRFKSISKILLWPGVRLFSMLGYRLWLLWYARNRKKREMINNNL